MRRIKITAWLPLCFLTITSASMAHSREDENNCKKGCMQHVLHSGLRKLLLISFHDGCWSFLNHLPMARLTSLLAGCICLATRRIRSPAWHAPLPATTT
jgi:hypothetical protein